MSTGALILAVLLASCAPQVELARPDPVQATRWNGAAPTAGEEPQQGLAQAFGSSELAALVERAEHANPDIGAALARVQQARAGLRAARAETEPVVTSSVGIGAARSDESGTFRYQYSAASAGIDLSWEADLFGRLSAGRRAARARLAAAQFDRDAMALVVEAELTRAFVRHAALGARIELLDEQLTRARELQRIIGVRQRLGAATRVDLGLQSTEVRQLEVERTRLIEAQHRTSNALAVLVGDEAPLFAAPTTPLAELIVPAAALVQPPELLVRRPDMRAAEARIAAASGDVEAARRAFLPQLRIGASGLVQAATLSGPVGSLLSIGADLLGTIFNRGRLHARLASATASQRESVELYRGALLQALREAEDALTGIEQSRRRAQLLDQNVEEARLTARLAQRQYVEGYADLQRVLDAQARLVSIEDSRVIALQERMEAAIDLYRAIGGRARAETAVARARR